MHAWIIDFAYLIDKPCDVAAASAGVAQDPQTATGAPPRSGGRPSFRKLEPQPSRA
jgi:hypothetical protein